MGVESDRHQNFSKKKPEKNFRKKKFSKKKNSKKLYVKKIFRKKKFEKIKKKNVGNLFVFEKKFGRNSVNFRKKNRKNFDNIFCNFFILKKKSVNSPIKG